MLAAFRQLGLLWQVLSILGIVGGAGGALWALHAHIRHQGYVEGAAAARAHCATEKAAQRKANEEAIDASNRQLMRLADQIRNTEQETDDAVMAALAAAAADPTGDRECLPLGSVQRLSPIR